MRRGNNIWKEILKKYTDDMEVIKVFFYSWDIPEENLHRCFELLYGMKLSVSTISRMIKTGFEEKPQINLIGFLLSTSCSDSALSIKFNSAF